MAYNPIYTTGDEPSLLLKVLRGAWWSRELQPQRWKKIFKIEKADQAVEYELEMRNVSMGNLKLEGKRSQITNAGEGLKTAYKVNTYSNVIYATFESLQDNLYKKDWGLTSMGMAEAQDQLRNVVMFSLFNNARNQGSVGADREPLLSTQHKTAESTYSNTLQVPASISLNTINQFTQIIQLFVNYRGQPLTLNPRQLITSVQNSQKAQVIMFSPEDPTTANRAQNPQYHGGYFPDGLLTTPYIRSPLDYFAQSDSREGFTFFERQPVMTQELPYTDALTFGFIMWERFARLYSTARCVAGVSFGN